MTVSKTPFRRKGEKIYQDDGSYLCTLARDCFSNEISTIDQFCDWAGPIPRPGDSIHPAIIKHIAPNP